MLKKQPKVAVLILNFHTDSVTQQCLVSLSRTQYASWDVWLLDVEISRSHRTVFENSHLKLHYFHSRQNLGFAGGNNYLIRQITKSNKNYDYVVLLNNDTEVKPEWLSQLVSVAEKESQCGAVSCGISYFDDPQRIWFAGGYLHPWLGYTRHTYMNQLWSSLHSSSKPITTDWLTGCALLIRWQTLQQVGLLDEDYFAYMEDVDWSWRAKQFGWDLKVLSQPLVLHKVSSSFGNSGSNKLSALRAYYYARNGILFIRKQWRGLQFISGMFGQLCIRFPYYSLQIIKSKEIKPLLAYGKGLWHGLVMKPSMQIAVSKPSTSVQNTQAWTHERLVPADLPWYNRQTLYDHLARYQLASQYVAQKTVLDIACGSGYGSHLLATQNAKKVVGVDISAEAIDYAQSQYSHKKITFIQGSAEKIPCQDNQFDMVVSFETLEHVQDYNKFISEILRVLKSEGQLIISTPNKLLGSETGNPFHIKEFFQDEFLALMKNKFQKVSLYGQKPMHASYLKIATRIVNVFPPGFIRWIVDTGLKIIFRGSSVQSIETFRFGFTPAFFIAVCNNPKKKHA